MKLFLSSHNFGDFAEDLQNLVGEKRKTLLIANARDYRDPDYRTRVVKEKLQLFRDNGFDATELDLREYFAKDPAELEKYVTDYDPGLIFCIGGNVFLLATALAISGLDDIIRRRLEEGITVYGGNSAGAMVTARDIEIYERDDLKIEEVPAYYGIESITCGLELVDQYIIPHADLPERAKITKFYQSQIAKAHEDPILLGERDVYIVDDGKYFLKRAD